MKVYTVILAIVMSSCQSGVRQEYIALRDKYLLLDSAYNRERFRESTCQAAVDSSRWRFQNRKFELYAFITSDSSHTPIHLLQRRFKLQVRRSADVDDAFKFCFNEGMIGEFERKYGFNPIDSIKLVYDSLYEMGLTNIQPKFKGGREGFKKYMICSLEFPEGMQITPPYPVVEISFRLSPAGDADRVKIIRSYSPKYDSAALKVVRMMPSWTPARGEDGKYQEQLIQWRFRFDPMERNAYCQ